MKKNHFLKCVQKKKSITKKKKRKCAARIRRIKKKKTILYKKVIQCGLNIMQIKHFFRTLKKTGVVFFSVEKKIKKL